MDPPSGFFNRVHPWVLRKNSNNFSTNSENCESQSKHDWKKMTIVPL